MYRTCEGYGKGMSMPRDFDVEGIEIYEYKEVYV